MDAFSAEQLQWAALRDEPGFVAQCGGSVMDTGSQVQIFGLWADMDSYQAFMGSAHDRIFKSGKQGACYTDAESMMYERVLDLPGVESNLADALRRGAAIIRIARCDVLPERVEHFVEMQRSVWQDGMRDAPGMLGGNFWRAVDDKHRFIVTTAWASVEDHEQYRAQRLDGLRAQAKPGDDLVSIEGRQIVLTPAWTALG